MPIDWSEIEKIVIPVKSYQELCARLQHSLEYPFVRETFNFSMPALAEYTHLSVGGDQRHRYDEYAGRLIGIFDTLGQAGVKDTLDLLAKTGSRECLEDFTATSGIPAKNIASALKFLLYWFIPGEKYLSGLVRDDPEASAAIKVLAGIGVKTNLALLERGRSPSGRKALAEASGLPEPVVTGLVHRADLSRMPWASKATIANIVGAGYGSLARLAQADPQKLYEDFFRYGKTIGKNLKLGNEIENSHRIARIVPGIVEA